MKPALALLFFTVSASAQMTDAVLLRLDRSFAHATTQKRLEGWMKYMMESTVIFGPQHTDQRIVGKQEIRSYYRDMFAIPNFTMTWTPMSAQVLPSGMTGYTKGRFHWFSPNPRCNCINDWHGTYLAVWEQEYSAHGKWKLKALFPSVDNSSISCGCGT